MIMDDNVELQEVLTDFLESDAHSVVSAKDVATAREMQPQISPDIVFLEVGLPDATGLELLPDIKNTHPSARFIVISGTDNYRVEDLLFEAGPDQFIRQPFHRTDIQDSVRKLLA